MRILVTGGAGYIGSHTCVALLSEGHEVAILDNLCNSSIEVLKRMHLISDKTSKFFQVDLEDFEAVDNVFESFKPEAVIHFAALKSVEESLQNPLRYYQSNVLGSLVLFDIMKKRNIKKLVFSSSANVYGNAEIVPIKEDALIRPTNPYGHTKAMVEKILSDIVLSNKDWRAVILRYFNPIGAHISGLIGEDCKSLPSNLLPYISQVAIGKLDLLKIYGNDYLTNDGTGVRDYIHVMDLASGHLAALNYLDFNQGLVAINLGVGNGYSVLQILKEFEKANKVKIPYQIVERRAGDVEISFADNSLAKQLLNWKPKYNLEDMCKDAWRWQVMNPNGFC